MGADVVSGSFRGPARARPRRFSLRRREAVACALFIAPAVLGFVAFTVIPLLASLGLSFTQYDLAGTPKWLGLKNYGTIFSDELWLQSVKVSITYAVVVVPLWLVNSLALALVMNQNLRGISLFRTVYYLPAMLSGVAVSMLWVWLLNYHSGVINALLQSVGIPGQNWLGDRRWALIAIIVMSQWSIGWYLPIWLSGLQGIPTELYEAATMDGCGAGRRLMSITLPMLSPVILYNLVMNVIWATQLFTEPFMMTGGGPDNATLAYMLYLYRTGFSYFRLGQASAMAWVLFAAVLAATLLTLKSSPMWVHYEGERRRA